MEGGIWGKQILAETLKCRVYCTCHVSNHCTADITHLPGWVEVCHKDGCTISSLPHCSQEQTTAANPITITHSQHHSFHNHLDISWKCLVRINEFFCNLQAHPDAFPPSFIKANLCSNVVPFTLLEGIQFHYVHLFLFIYAFTWRIKGSPMHWSLPKCPV